MPTPKPSGYPCPTCGAKPAEFKAATDKVMRWRCSCGAEGVITNPYAVYQDEPAKGPTVHKHWTRRG